MYTNAVTNSSLINGNEHRKVKQDAVAQCRPTRLGFWEIDLFFKCPVVGMCMTLSEQKQLLKKMNIPFKGMDAFQIHEIFVSSSDAANRLSRKIDSLIDRKFIHEARELRGFREEEFMQQWRSRFEAGNYKGALWVAATRADLSVEAKYEVFGSVHMAMHGSIEQVAKFKQKLIHEQTQIRELLGNHKETVRIGKALQKENASLQKDLRELQRKLAVLEKDKTRLADQIVKLRSGAYEALGQENALLRAEIDVLSQQLEKHKDRLAALEKENRRLSDECSKQRDLNIHVSNEMRAMIQQYFDVSGCNRNCSAFDLCQKRVLIVGGITRMESLYRQMIESSGGVFEYHDGDVKGGVRELENSVKRADIVLCPVNCNSHGACSLVKKLGKKHNKPIHMLGNSSLSSVSQVILGG